MSGFDNAKVDEEFFGAGAERERMCEEYVPGTLKSNFLCNIGCGDRPQCAVVLPASSLPRPAMCCEPRFSMSRPWDIPLELALRRAPVCARKTSTLPPTA